MDWRVQQESAATTQGVKGGSLPVHSTYCFLDLGSAHQDGSPQAGYMCHGIWQSPYCAPFEANEGQHVGQDLAPALLQNVIWSQSPSPEKDLLQWATVTE